MDASSCNYVSAAEFDDGSCEYESCLDECGVLNGDNSTCYYDGNELIQIGDQRYGGIIFQINEDGTGLVADLQDLPPSNWHNAISAAQNSTSGGYDDWYLPSLDELLLMYSTIGQGATQFQGNVGGFVGNRYWSSSEDCSWQGCFPYNVNFGSTQLGQGWLYFSSTPNPFSYTPNVRAIRAF